MLANSLAGMLNFSTMQNAGTFVLDAGSGLVVSQSGTASTNLFAATPQMKPVAKR